MKIHIEKGGFWEWFAVIVCFTVGLIFIIFGAASSSIAGIIIGIVVFLISGIGLSYLIRNKIRDDREFKRQQEKQRQFITIIKQIAIDIQIPLTESQAKDVFYKFAQKAKYENNNFFRRKQLTDDDMIDLIIQSITEVTGKKPDMSKCDYD